MFAQWKLLLIDDDEADRLAFRRIMKEEGIAATLPFACDGVEALAVLSNADEIPDLVILDLNLGGVDGFDVLSKLKADPNLRVVPVVVLTTSADPHDIERSYKAGASSYIVKPASIDGLRKVVRGLADYWSALVARPA
jgi:two-component system response regulator